MRSLVRWEPFSDLISLRDAMDRLFEESFVRPTSQALAPWGGGELAVDMYEADNNIVVKASTPGVKPEDIDISVVGNTLTIKGETKQEQEVKEENYIRRERRYGSFMRSIPLPVDVNADKAVAEFENGVLTVKIPRAEEATAKTIKIAKK